MDEETADMFEELKEHDIPGKDGATKNLSISLMQVLFLFIHF